MKVLLMTVLVLGAALAEPAFRRQQQQQAPQTPQEAEDSDAPYAPSGWKPSGQRLEHPSKQYGAPEEEDAQTEQPVEQPAEQPSAQPKAVKAAPSRSEKQQAAPEPQFEGEYHVILPDGRLQRVQFAAKVQASPVEGQGNQKDVDDEVADEVEEPASPHSAAPKPVTRPAHRPQPAPQQQQQQFAVVAAPQYVVLLPDGSLQQVQFFGKLEAEQAAEPQEGQDEVADEPSPRPAAPRAAAPRPQSAPRRPQPQRVQQRPVVLLPQPQQPQHQDEQHEGVPAVPTSFVAELRFMEVPPITGPVYSYSGPLVRVQREAYLH